MSTVGEKMTAVANAIRTKTGSTDKLTLDAMVSSLNNIPERTSSNLSASGATVTVPAGNYKSQAAKSVTTVSRADTIISVTADDTNDKLTITASNNQGTGYVTGSNKTATKTITLTTSGSTVTASDGTNKVSKSVATTTQATPSISINSSGLITASATQTAGYVAAGTKSGTKQLTTKAAATITPSTSNQTIASGTYLTGTQTIAGDADLVASNIKKGINIFGIAGSYEGVELNFEVVGGTTAPSNPTENTIWVNTSTTISGWVFSPAEPTSPEPNSVWICIGSASGVWFNAIVDNGINLYPLYVKQYINGSWINKIAKTRKNGEWVDWATYIVKQGVLVGNFNLSGNLRSTNPYSLSSQSGYLRVYDTYGITSGVAISNGLDITNISKLVLICRIINAGSPTELGCGLGLAKALGAGSSGSAIGNIVTSQMRIRPGDYTLELNVNDYSGIYYPCIWSTSVVANKVNIYIYDFYYI